MRCVNIGCGHPPGKHQNLASSRLPGPTTSAVGKCSSSDSNLDQQENNHTNSKKKKKGPSVLEISKLFSSLDSVSIHLFFTCKLIYPTKKNGTRNL